WAKASIDFLIRAGLLNGYEDQTFRPDLGITRAEAAKILAMEMGLEETPNTFSDVPATHWAAGYIGAAQKSGLMNGYEDGAFRPEDMLNRAEMAALVARAFQLAGSSGISFPDVQSGTWSYQY